MEALIKLWKTSRAKYLEFLEKYTLEQLNKVPEGFSNNLIWNIGHIVVAQQGLVYKSSEVEWHISMELYDRYKSGTRPERDVTQAEIDELKHLLIALIAQTEADLAAGKFTKFNERTTGTGFHLGNLQDALHFNNYHEAIHLGIMMGIRRFV